MTFRQRRLLPTLPVSSPPCSPPSGQGEPTPPARPPRNAGNSVSQQQHSPSLLSQAHFLLSHTPTMGHLSRFPLLTHPSREVRPICPLLTHPSWDVCPICPLLTHPVLFPCPHNIARWGLSPATDERLDIMPTRITHASAHPWNRSR